MLNIEKFKQLLGTWGDKFSPFLSTGEFENIYKVLKEKSRRGISIFPESSQTYKAFEYCDYNNLKAIIVGMCPYHTKKDNIIVADGIALSCGNTNKLQPSLENWYKGIEEDLCGGMNLDMYQEPDLSFLSSQGVLMLNAALTVESGKAGSHQQLWEPFMKFFFIDIIGKYNRGLPIVFLGKEAEKYAYLVDEKQHYIKIVEHPAASSYAQRDWKHDNLFSWVNNIIKKNNGSEYEIKWYDNIPF